MSTSAESTDAIEQALRREHNHLRTLLNTLPDLIWLKDQHGVYLSCNDLFEQFFGASESEIKGKTDYDFVDAELAGFFRQKDLEAMAAGKPTTNEEWITFAVGGGRCLLETVKTPMYDEYGELTGVLGIARDITKRHQLEEQLREANEKLQRLASTDYLTGVANRRQFDRQLNNEWRHCQRNRQPLAMILFDLDFFKTFNDSYGHQEGDSCLARIGELLKSGNFCNRPGDLVARYGGEEFALILSQTRAADALNIANRICREVAALEIANEASLSEGFGVITISAGVTAIVADQKCSPDDLINRADQALYQAKAQGRNRCVLSS